MRGIGGIEKPVAGAGRAVSCGKLLLFVLPDFGAERGCELLRKWLLSLVNTVFHNGV